jgi:hypothetical protein
MSVSGFEGREVHFEHRRQGLERLGARRKAGFDALDRAHAQPARFGELLLRPSPFQAQLLDEHLGLPGYGDPNLASAERPRHDTGATRSRHGRDSGPPRTMIASQAID